jgi:hypothetical protein
VGQIWPASNIIGPPKAPQINYEYFCSFKKTFKRNLGPEMQKVPNAMSQEGSDPT